MESVGSILAGIAVEGLKNFLYKRGAKAGALCGEVFMDSITSDVDDMAVCLLGKLANKETGCGCKVEDRKDRFTGGKKDTDCRISKRQKRLRRLLEEKRSLRGKKEDEILAEVRSGKLESSSDRNSISNEVKKPDITEGKCFHCGQDVQTGGIVVENDNQVINIFDLETKEGEKNVNDNQNLANFMLCTDDVQKVPSLTKVTVTSEQKTLFVLEDQDHEIEGDVADMDLELQRHSRKNISFNKSEDEPLFLMVGGANKIRGLKFDSQNGSSIE